MDEVQKDINPECNTFFILGKHLEFTFFSISIKTEDQLLGLERT